MKHYVTLSNGETLEIQEENDGLSIAAMHDGQVFGYICQLNKDGVLSYTNSGNATEFITRGFKQKNPDTKMMVSLDGGVNYSPVLNGVRVQYNEQLLPGNHEGDLHVQCTNEGIIMDVWADSTEPQTGDNIGTSSETTDEIIERLVESR